MPRELLLVDGHSLVHRAYHALPPLTTSHGEPTNAVYGFTAMLLKTLADEQPEFVAVAFDRAAPTFRHLRFEAYKAHRPQTPDDLVSQFARVRQIVAALGIPSFELDGYEADDVLGTLARQAREFGVPTVVLTGDLDALQLVRPEVRVLTSRKGVSDLVCFDEAAVRERYGLEPSQLPDFKGLKGDPSDNIPGVPGIGDKTASKLLQRFGSIENAFSHLDEVEPKLRARLTQFADQARQSRDLATIDAHAPVALELEACRVSAYDRDRAVALLRELEFPSLLSRLPAPQAAAMPTAVPMPGEGPQQMDMFEALAVHEAPARARSLLVAPRAEVSAPPLSDHYYLVDDAAALDELLERLKRVPRFALDVETTSKDPMRAELVGVSISPQQGEAYYLPVGHLALEEGRWIPAPGQLPREYVLDALRPLLADEQWAKCGHNAKYDAIVLEQHGVRVVNIAFDTMVAGYLLNERGLSLSDLAFARFGIEMTPITALIGTGRTQITMAEVAIGAAAPYACADADMTMRLAHLYEKELAEQGLTDLFVRVEMPLVPVLGRMEQTGVAIDSSLLKEISRELYGRISELERRIYAEVGHDFNVNSTQQLGRVLFEELGLPTMKRTKAGYSTDVSVLEELRQAHPVVQSILEYRQLMKLKSTYVDALPQMVHPRTGRVHTSFNQTVASTGRLSSSDPNLQNIPVRTDLGRQVRRAFIAGGPDRWLISADYSQIELRVLAHYSSDPRLLAAFAANEDIHTSTASAVYGVAAHQVTSEMRRVAKVVNFGIIYGMSEYGLSQSLDLSRREAQAFIAQYMAQYPGVRQYIEDTKRMAYERGYVATLLGRRRYLPELRSANRGLREATERMAINMPIQGTAADIIKLAMVDLQCELERRRQDGAMILQVHDELVLEAERAELPDLVPLLCATMEGVMPELTVPLKVDVKVGRNWEEMEPYR